MEPITAVDLIDKLQNERQTGVAFMIGNTQSGWALSVSAMPVAEESAVEQLLATIVMHQELAAYIHHPEWGATDDLQATLLQLSMTDEILHWNVFYHEGDPYLVVLAAGDDAVSAMGTLLETVAGIEDDFDRTHCIEEYFEPLDGEDQQ